MRNLARLAVLAVFLLTLPISAQVQKPALPEAPKAKPMFTQDLGSGGSGGGSCVSDTCYRLCRDGSVASIGCNTYENAYCGCDGLSRGGSIQAFTACTACTP